MLYTPIPDEDHLRDHIATAEAGGRLITDATARELATWLAAATGPGFNAFVLTGRVTSPVYTELSRFYDIRRAEAEQWLDALTRYLMRQTLAGAGSGSVPPKRGRS